MLSKHSYFNLDKYWNIGSQFSDNFGLMCIFLGGSKDDIQIGKGFKM